MGAGGIGAVAAAVLLVVWLRSGPADNPSTAPATTPNAGTSNSPTAPAKTDTPPTKADNPAVVAGTKAEPAATTPPAAETAPPKATTPEPAAAAPATSVDPRVVELQGFRTAAKDQWQRGDVREAANSLVSAMKLAPGNPDPWDLALDLMRQSRAKMQDARKAATDARAQSTRAYQDGDKKAADGERSENGPGVKGGPKQACRGVPYGAAIDLFRKVATDGRAVPPSRLRRRA